ncbi:hypothetical protein MWL59_25950 [Escherichia coli]|nr:hypothetical protein [Escherichia coli]
MSRTLEQKIAEAEQIAASEGKEPEPGHSTEGRCRCCIAGKGQKAGGGAIARLVTPVPEGRGDTAG